MIGVPFGSSNGPNTCDVPFGNVSLIDRPTMSHPSAEVSFPDDTVNVTVSPATAAFCDRAIFTTLLSALQPAGLRTAAAAPDTTTATTTAAAANTNRNADTGFRAHEIERIYCPAPFVCATVNCRLPRQKRAAPKMDVRMPSSVWRIRVSRNPRSRTPVTLLVAEKPSEVAPGTLRTGRGHRPVFSLA